MRAQPPFGNRPQKPRGRLPVDGGVEDRTKSMAVPYAARDEPPVGKAPPHLRQGSWCYVHTAKPSVPFQLKRRSDLLVRWRRCQKPGALKRPCPPGHFLHLLHDLNVDEKPHPAPSST